MIKMIVPSEFNVFRTDVLAPVDRWKRAEDVGALIECPDHLREHLEAAGFVELKPVGMGIHMQRP